MCCGKDRKVKSAADTRTTIYVVTWGDGKREEFKTIPAARVAMSVQKDAAKRKGMSMTTKRV